MANNHSVHDLSGEVEILSYRPVFSGPYSNVYRGKLKESNQLVSSSYSLVSRLTWKLSLLLW